MRRMSKLEIILYRLSIAVVCTVSFLFILYLGICWWEKEEVKSIYEEACSKYPGTEVEALITYLKKTKELRKKNRAIWALGELRDKKVLPILEALYTGAPCDHSRFVCQYEVKKAIKKIKGEIPNPYFWR